MPAVHRTTGCSVNSCNCAPEFTDGGTCMAVVDLVKSEDLYSTTHNVASISWETIAAMNGD